MSGATPGPWEYNDPEKYNQGYGKFSEIAVYAPGNAFPWRMAEVSGPNDATAIANARLIAAAPDLLAALERLMEQPTMSLLKMTPDQRKELWAAHEQARAAISRARLEQKDDRP